MEMETPPWDAHKQQADQDRNLCLYCAYTLLLFIISYFEKHFWPNHCHPLVYIACSLLIFLE